MSILLKRALDREGFVRANLVQTIVDCVKELQLKYAAERSEYLTNDECTNALCYCLEAMFIHGLKSPFLKSVSSVLNTPREHQLPHPSFWEFILIFCHQDVILQINTLRHINTDVGRSRAWLRVVLNDGLLISYIQLVMGDKRVLKEYYKPGAFFRDTERCDVVKSYLYGIESYNFQLASNSSLLNTWNSTPLTLVGLWTPSDVVAQGVDVVENMEAKDLQALPNLKQQSEYQPRNLPYDSIFARAPLLEEDEALRLILSSKGSKIPHVTVTLSSAEVSSSSISEPQSQKGDLQGNSFNEIKTGDNHVSADPETVARSERQPSPGSSTGYGSQENVTAKMERTESSQEQIPITPQEDEGSYAALFQSYSRSDSVIGTPIGVGSPVTIGSFLQSTTFLPFEPKHTQTTVSCDSTDPYINPNPVGDHRSSITGDCDFEVVPRAGNDAVPDFDDDTGGVLDLPVMLQGRIQTIPNESGLDAQDYRCKQCNRPIGMLYGAARVCGFSGNYYCGDCHLNDECVIPSRILINWDFTRCTVSRKAKDFLDEIGDKPIFDLNKINPKLYEEVEEFAEIVKLRSQLNSVSLYLLTCKDGSIQELLTKEFWMKEHIYREIHTYSISDLLNVPNRQLITTLQRIVAIGEEHIKSCVVCRQKGFICEMCRDTQVIFPFELDSTFKCQCCGAVYHNNCMNNTIQCPRCDRWKF